VNGLALTLAPSQHRLGDGEPPLLATAKGATLLLLDEVGFEMHLEVIRDVIFHRYERGAPTIVASERTAEELEGRYGAALMRRLWESGRGMLIDLHPSTG
jgi:DNA replication protein DnaC